jgi:hypothetical protein
LGGVIFVSEKKEVEILLVPCGKERNLNGMKHNHASHSARVLCMLANLLGCIRSLPARQAYKMTVERGLGSYRKD